MKETHYDSITKAGAPGDEAVPGAFPAGRSPEEYLRAACAILDGKYGEIVAAGPFARAERPAPAAPGRTALFREEAPGADEGAAAPPLMRAFAGHLRLLRERNFFDVYIEGLMRALPERPAPAAEPAPGGDESAAPEPLPDGGGALRKELGAALAAAENPLEVMNALYLRRILEGDGAPAAAPLARACRARPELVRRLALLPAPLALVAGHRSLAELAGTPEGAGLYLRELFAHLRCDHELFGEEGRELKKRAARIQNGASLRFYAIRNLCRAGLNVNEAAEFVNSDYPELYRHYLIRNRRYHTPKYGLRRTAGQYRGRRKTPDGITGQAALGSLRRISLFISVYETLTGRREGGRLVMSDNALTAAALLTRQAVKFTGESVPERLLADDLGRAAAVIGNTCRRDGLKAPESLRRLRGSLETCLRRRKARAAEKADLLARGLIAEPEIRAMLADLRDRDPAACLTEGCAKGDQAAADLRLFLTAETYENRRDPDGFRYRTFSGAPRLGAPSFRRGADAAGLRRLRADMRSLGR